MLEADLRAALPEVMALAGMGGFLCDLPSGRAFLDPGALRIFDVEPSAFDGRVATLSERIRPGELRRIRQLIAGQAPGRSDYGFHFQIRSAAGKADRWAYAQVHVLRDGSGAARRLVGFLRDVTAELQGATDRASLAAGCRHRSDVVYVTTTALAQALTFEDVLTALTSEEILSVVGASGVALSMVREDESRLLATKGLPEAVFDDFAVAHVQDALPIPEAVRSQRPLFLLRSELLSRYPVLGPYVGPTGVTSVATLPLVAEGRATGALTLLYEGRTDFTPEERNILLALGAAVAQSLERARLYDEEHAVAIGLQQAMLPARIPEVAGVTTAVRYRPASDRRKIGGDWYDIVALPNGHIGLVVGDVEGHDIDASAVMGQLRTALRAFASEGHSPSTVMARASAFLGDLDTERLATCIYVTLDPESGNTLIVRAGHPGPLVRHADRSVSSIAVPGGILLGVPGAGDTPCPVTRYRMERGDTLLLCTDGLLENRDSGLDTGEREVRELLRSGPGDLGELAEHIINSVASRRMQEDDVALLLAALPERATRAA
ncbi:SpoIIE family protein phosphatase [Streptomyces sp. NPDC052207]|uniref:SpoIIE family protein phosphatase n=1 Tax=Streptomyces sp. NPDC052207 TaxID=3155418 RepID=UPI00341C5F12